MGLIYGLVGLVVVVLVVAALTITWRDWLWSPDDALDGCPPNVYLTLVPRPDPTGIVYDDARAAFLGIPAAIERHGEVVDRAKPQRGRRLPTPYVWPNGVRAGVRVNGRTDGGDGSTLDLITSVLVQRGTELVLTPFNPAIPAGKLTARAKGEYVTVLRDGEPLFVVQMRGVARKPSDVPYDLRCPECGRPAPTEDDVRRHREVCHPQALADYRLAERVAGIIKTRDLL